MPRRGSDAAGMSEMLPGGYNSDRFSMSRKLVSRSVPVILMTIFFGCASVSAQAPQTSAICAKDRFAKGVTAYLIQRCFNENRLMELRRAIQRQQLQLESGNQRTADELMDALGIDRGVLNGFMLLLGELEADAENQAEYLADIVNNYRILLRDLARLSAEDEETQVFDEIAAEIARGQWTAASRLALVMETRALSSRQQGGNDGPLRSERAAIAEFVLGQIALVRANFTEAARHFTTAADYADPATPAGRSFHEAAADALYNEAKRRWNERTLQEAIDIYRRVLDARPRSEEPELWARAQGKLGAAILRLGAGTRSVPLITGAISAFEAALEVRTRETAREEWARISADLAGALMQFGNAMREAKALRESAEAYRQALSGISFEESPGLWVEWQTNLGNVLWSLGRLEEDSAPLNEAITVFTSALGGLDAERQARDWGATQNNIGAAYFLLAERNDGVEDARNAVRAFQASLDAYREASAVYFISGVRKNLVRAQSLLQERLSRQPPPSAASAPAAGNQPVR